MYRGARVPTGDYFDDIVNPSHDGGVLGGMGLDDYDRVSRRLTDEGVEIEQLSCRVCGKKANLVVTWEELFYISRNGPGQPVILPKGWRRSEQNMTCYIMVRCNGGRCSDGYYAVHFTPDQANQMLLQAGNSGLITRDQVQRWMEKAQRIAAQQGAGFYNP